MRKFIITYKGQQYELGVEEVTSNESESFRKTSLASAAQAAVPPAAENFPASASGPKTVAAPMPGKILKVNVKQGDMVKRGDVLMILEAMKMENEIISPINAKVSQVCVSVGATVAANDELVVLG